MKEKIFSPHELKTIEVDVDKKIFRVNGEDFGKGCTRFSIVCDANEREFFKVTMRIDTTVKFYSYNRQGEKQGEKIKGGIECTYQNLAVEPYSE